MVMLYRMQRRGPRKDTGETPNRMLYVLEVLEPICALYVSDSRAKKVSKVKLYRYDA